MIFGKVLVGYGGGDSSRDALKLAVLLQRCCGAELVLSHVYRHESAGGADTRIAERAKALQILREAEALLPYGATAELRPVKARSVTQGLHDVAEQEDAGLIVVGSEPPRPPHSLHSASVAERLLHAAPCAVAVAPHEFALDPDPALRVIGVAYDAGDEARAAAHVARDLAISTRATIRLIGVAETVGNTATGMAAMSGWVDAEGIGRDRVLHDLEQMADDLPNEVRAQVVLGEGNPAEEILKRAGTLSLLVMGSRGYGPVRRALLGSVSGPVVRATPCPVLVLPRDSGPGSAAAAKAAAAAAAALGTP